MTDKERAEKLKNLFAQADAEYRKGKHDLYSDAYNSRNFHNAEPDYDFNGLLFNFSGEPEKRTNKRRRQPSDKSVDFEGIFNQFVYGGSRQYGKTHEAKQDKFYTNCDIVTRKDPKKYLLTTKDAKEYTQFTIPF